MSSCQSYSSESDANEILYRFVLAFSTSEWSARSVRSNSVMSRSSILVDLFDDGCVWRYETNIVMRVLDSH